MLPTVRKSTRIVRTDEHDKSKEIKKSKALEKSHKPVKIEEKNTNLQIKTEYSPRKSSRNAQRTSKAAEEVKKISPKQPSESVKSPILVVKDQPEEKTEPLKIATPSPLPRTYNLSNVKIMPNITFRITPANMSPFKNSSAQSSSDLKISSVKGDVRSIVITNAKMIPFSASGIKLNSQTPLKLPSQIIIKSPNQPIKMEKIPQPIIQMESPVILKKEEGKSPLKIVNQAIKTPIKRMHESLNLDENQAKKKATKIEPRVVKLVKITPAGKVVLSKNQPEAVEKSPEIPYESRRSGLRGVKININDLLGRKAAGSSKKIKTPPKVAQPHSSKVQVIQVEPFDAEQQFEDAETYVCKKCPCVFDSRKELMMHRRAHQKSDFECDKCHATFKFLTSYNNHNCDFYCNYCHKSISNKANLKIHMSYVHGIGDAKLFSCDLCCRTYKSKRNIDSHMKNHMVETPHNCSICGKGFSHRGALKIHMWNHRDVVECELCSRKFKPRSLYYHIKKCQGVLYSTRRKEKLKIVNVMAMNQEEEEVEEEVMFEEYIEEYENDDDDVRLQWNYGVEVIKNEKN